jgi:hypothetical protein
MTRAAPDREEARGARGRWPARAGTRRTPRPRDQRAHRNVSVYVAQHSQLTLSNRPRSVALYAQLEPEVHGRGSSVCVASALASASGASALAARIRIGDGRLGGRQRNEPRGPRRTRTRVGGTVGAAALVDGALPCTWSRTPARWSRSSRVGRRCINDLAQALGERGQRRTPPARQRDRVEVLHGDANHAVIAGRHRPSRGVDGSAGSYLAPVTASSALMTNRPR